MEMNKGSKATDRLMELYQSAKTGSIGVCNDWARFADYIAEIEADDELKTEVIAILTARGITINKVKTEAAKGNYIKDAIVEKFPNAIATP